MANEPASVTLQVGGMSCMGCVNSVRNLLMALPGVESVDVDLASGRVGVRHDPDLVNVETLRAAIAEGGYQV